MRAISEQQWVKNWEKLKNKTFKQEKRSNETTNKSKTGIELRAPLQVALCWRRWSYPSERVLQHRRKRVLLHHKDVRGLTLDGEADGLAVEAHGTHKVLELGQQVGQLGAHRHRANDIMAPEKLQLIATATKYLLQQCHILGGQTAMISFPFDGWTVKGLSWWENEPIFLQILGLTTKVFISNI